MEGVKSCNMAFTSDERPSAKGVEGVKSCNMAFTSDERPSAKGEGFKLRLKPVRVGLTADSRILSTSPRETGWG
jgi:hypothetical protein